MWGSSWALGDIYKTVWPRGSSPVEAEHGGLLFLLTHACHISHSSGGKGGVERLKQVISENVNWGCKLRFLRRSLWATSNMSVSLWLSEKALQSLLESLTCPPYTPTQHLEREQALAKEFAEILHFTLRFDELKVRPRVLGQFNRFLLST